ncbi:MAG: Hsp20/alpha crystallin family protein [Candidatus Eremiobacteraeota bacterium]|nr:Hsp20/alpha crystallin family protein [Candidatus Eremiobacteraeota bacterium]
MNSSLVVGRTPARGAGSRPLFDIFGLDPFRNFTTNASQLSGMEITRNESGFVVEVAVPGFRPEDLDVTVESEVLAITGKTEKRSFTRSLVLPEEIDTENIGAKVENGLLTLTLAFVPKVAPKKIEIKTN